MMNSFIAYVVKKGVYDSNEKRYIAESELIYDRFGVGRNVTCIRKISQCNYREDGHRDLCNDIVGYVIGDDFYTATEFYRKMGWY